MLDNLAARADRSADRPQYLRAGDVVYIKATVKEDHGDGAIVEIANDRGSSRVFVGTSQIGARG